MSETNIGDFVEILEQVKSDKELKVEDKSTSTRKVYVVSSKDRITTSASIHEMLDEKGISYVSKVMSGSSFPSTLIALQGTGKVKAALFRYKPVKGKAADAKTTLMQEKASTYVFERVLKDNITWPSPQECLKMRKP